MTTFTRPGDPRPYEKQREDYLPAAGLMFTAATLRGIADDWKAALPSHELNENQWDAAYKQAASITHMYEQLYASPDRHYHTLQHPRVQLLDMTGQKLLQDISQQQLATRDGEQAARKVADMMTPELAANLRDQDRHDCLYYFANGNSEQHRLLDFYKRQTNPPLRLEQMVRQSHPLEAGTPLPFDPSTTIGELAAVAMFPDGQGGYDKNRTFEGTKRGLNEWASVVQALAEENKQRQVYSNPLSAREMLRACATIAMTIPFEKAGTAEAMAANLHRYLSAPAREQSRHALGLKNDAEIRDFIDEITCHAVKLANRDVGNFGSPDPIEKYWGDRSVRAELSGIDPTATDPVKQFRIAYGCYDDNASAEERQKLNKSATGSGFSRMQADAKVIFHDFKAPLSGNAQHRVEGAAEKHAMYFHTAPHVQAEHQKDMTYEALHMVAALEDRKPVVANRQEVTLEMAAAFFDGRPSGAEVAVKVLSDTKDMRDLKGKGHALEEFVRKAKEIEAIKTGRQH